MIPAIRQQTILDLLQNQDILYLEDLLNELNISVSTLRRDLRELERQGRVIQLHGGGVRLAVQPPLELQMSAKLELNKEAKDRIARKAVSLIRPGDFIFLDPSSATLQMIPYLQGMDLTVVTNSIFHINQLCALGISSIMIGGNIKTSTNSCIGYMAEHDLSELNFSKCFLGASGFSLKYGITNHDINEKKIKNIAMNNSVETFFLLDSSKYNVITMTKVAALAFSTIITEKPIPELEGETNLIIADE